MTPEEYEHYCAREWMKKHPGDKAVVTKKGPYGADGGIDIVITTVSGKQILGQCKHYWKEYKGGKKVITNDMIKAFRWDMEKRGVSSGVYFASIPFSSPAVREAGEDGIRYCYLPV